MEGCPCPACSAGFTRGYIHYAHKAGETTGPRLLTLHNLSYIQRLMADLRAGIDAGRLAQVVRAFEAGAAPSTAPAAAATGAV